MAAPKYYLVPIDFSKGSDVALKQAIVLARKHKEKLLLVHVISMALGFPEVGFRNISQNLERDVLNELEKLARRHGLRPTEYRTVVVRGADTAKLIANQAKKFHATMIIMGSHGRTGLQRFMLGSIAERTLRYAGCPVLIVKK